MSAFQIQKFQTSRIATIDVCAMGMEKHHIAAMLEFDVTVSREKIKKYKKDINKISFTAWLLKVISHTIDEHKHVAAYLKGKQSLIIFEDINISLAVEKRINGQKVPIPLVLEKVNKRSIESITKSIQSAKDDALTDKDIVLQGQSNALERFYYKLPGFLRRYFWRYLLKHPHSAFRKMGNVAVTSIGIAGNINGWFIPKSVHPICFGIGSIIKKPAVRENKIEIREMLNMTVLIDHDVIDGVGMARFISDLSGNIENGFAL